MAQSTATTTKNALKTIQILRKLHSRASDSVGHSLLRRSQVAECDVADGNELVESVRGTAAAEGASVVVVSAQVEAELVDLDAVERAECAGSPRESRARRKGGEQCVRHRLAATERVTD